MQNAMFRDTEVSTEVTCRCPQCGAEEKVPISFPCWMLDIFRDKTPGLCSACSEKIRQRNQQEADRREAMRRIEIAGVPAEFRQWNAAKGNGTLARFIRDHRDRNLLVIGANGKCKTRAAAYNLLLEAKAGQRCPVLPIIRSWRSNTPPRCRNRHRKGWISCASCCTRATSC